MSHNMYTYTEDEGDNTYFHIVAKLMERERERRGREVYKYVYQDDIAAHLYCKHYLDILQ